LWEYRTRSRPHTYSATLCWAACDRLAGIARRLNIADRAKYWATSARPLRERILAEAWDEKRGALTGAFGEPDLDASVLLFAELGLLSATDERFIKSCDTIGRESCAIRRPTTSAGRKPPSWHATFGTLTR
jgi:GH15 family glucan-1,4-alpha-glucosidase